MTTNDTRTLRTLATNLRRAANEVADARRVALALEQTGLAARLATTEDELRQRADAADQQARELADPAIGPVYASLIANDERTGVITQLGHVPGALATVANHGGIHEDLWVITAADGEEVARHHTRNPLALATWLSRFAVSLDIGNFYDLDERAHLARVPAEMACPQGVSDPQSIV